jgi:lysozyme family protein
LAKDDSCDRLFANELTLKDSFREELASCERERKEVVNVKLKEILKEKSMLVKVANQTEMERDNAKSRYEKVLLVAPYSSETNAHVVEDDGDCGDSQQQRRRREAMHETAQQSILKEQARIKELNARLFRTKRDTDRLSAAIEDVEKSNLALMHRIRGKSLEKSPDALKREQKVKEAKETQKGAESRLRDAVRAHDGLDQELRALEDALEKIQSHALRSAKKNYERAIESERGKKERLDRASNIEKKLLTSLRSLAKSSAKKADLVFASEAKIKTMETRTDVRDAVRVLRNAISSSSSSKKTKTKKQEESTSPPAYTNKHLAVQAVLNAAVPAREGTSFASSLKWSGKWSDNDDQSSLHSSESFLLQRV